MPALGERGPTALIAGAVALILAPYLCGYALAYARRRPTAEMGIGLWTWRYERRDDLLWNLFWPVHQVHRRWGGGAPHHRDHLDIGGP